jgi:hypothetical protein
VTGNVTGNLTGNSAGVHTGAVTGDVTGNADTATKIATITNDNIVQLAESSNANQQDIN